MCVITTVTTDVVCSKLLVITLRSHIPALVVMFVMLATLLLLLEAGLGGLCTARHCLDLVMSTSQRLTFHHHHQSYVASGHILGWKQNIHIN